MKKILAIILAATIAALPGAQAPGGNIGVALNPDDNVAFLHVDGSGNLLLAGSGSGAGVNLPGGNVGVALDPGGNYAFLHVDANGGLITAGGGNVTGSGAANRVTFWSGANAVTSNANLTFDGTLLSAPNISMSTGYLSGTKTAGSTGTTANLLVKIDTTGNVVTAATSDVGIMGVAISTAANGVALQVATRGIVTCVADNTTVIGHVLVVGTLVAGRVSDSGQTDSTAIPLSTQVVGKALSVATVGNTVTVQLYGPGHYGAQAGTGNGSVTSASVVTANGVSASVANPTTTPAFTFTLGAITPSSVATGAISSTTLLTLSSTGGTSAGGVLFGTQTNFYQSIVPGYLALDAAAGTDVGYQLKLANVVKGNFQYSGGQLLVDSVGSITFRISNGATLGMALSSGYGLTVYNQALGTTPADGLLVTNTTPAVVTGGLQVQMSPSVSFLGNVWKSAATAASQTQKFSINNLPVIGAASTSAILQFQHSNNGAAATTPMTLTSAGGLTVFGQLIGKGTATNDAAAAGYIGELLSAQLAAASAESLTTTVGNSVISLSLTAGDWEVTGAIHFIPASTTVVASLIASVSETDNTQGSVDSVGGYASIGAVYTSGGATMTATLAPVRISLAGTTTYYLVGTGTFSVSTCTQFGTLRARRLRRERPKGRSKFAVARNLPLAA